MNINMNRYVISLLLAISTPAFATDVPTSAEDTQPLGQGANIPSVVVYDTDGQSLNLLDAVAAKPSILIFYRGGWCPYCTRHLSALAEVDQDLQELGLQVFAISPDRPEKLTEGLDTSTFSYRLLSDSSMDAAKAFGLAFRVDDETLDLYKTYNIDLEEASGQNHHLLPVPAVYVVNQKGDILFAHTNPDYRERISPAALLEAARKAF